MRVEHAIEAFTQAGRAFQAECRRSRALKAAADDTAALEALAMHLAAEEPEALAVATRRLLGAQVALLGALGLPVAMDAAAMFKAAQAGRPVLLGAAEIVRTVALAAFAQPSASEFGNAGALTSQHVGDHMDLFYMAEGALYATPEWLGFLAAAAAFESAHLAHGGRPLLTPDEAHAALEGAARGHCQLEACAVRVALQAVLKVAGLPADFKAWPVRMFVSRPPRARA